MIKKFFGSAFIAVGLVFFLISAGFFYTYGPHSNLVAAVTEDCEQRIARGEFSGLGDRALVKCTDDYEYSEVGQEYEFGMYWGTLFGFPSIWLVLWGARLWQRNHKFTLKNFFGDTFIAFVGWWVVFWIVARVLLVL